jgi:hypothetical protein
MNKLLEHFRQCILHFCIIIRIQLFQPLHHLLLKI